MIENLAVISEPHLEDPDGAVERRLRMYSRSDVLQIKELEDILATPSPKASEIVRHWPDAMSCVKVDRLVMDDGSIAYCSTGVLLEAAGMPWGDCTSVLRTDLHGRATIVTYEEMGDLLERTYGLSSKDVGRVTMLHDHQGKEAAAQYLESIGL